MPDACVSGYACTNVPASATRDVYYSYDARGLQTAARFDSASGADAVTSGYDGFGRLTSSTTSMGGVSRTLSYLYDANGNRTRITHPDGNYFVYVYDGLDRMTGVHQNAGSAGIATSWDAQGRVAGQYRGGVGLSYGYDAISRPTGMLHDLAGSAYDLTTTLGYNPASQITSRTRSNDTYRFTGYVGVNRSYATNGLNQYSSAGGVSFGYDANGNLTASGSTAYTYDAENRLVVASTGATLTYDPLGRLYETYGTTTGATRFLYDGDQLTAEYSSAGVLLRRYVHGVGEDDPLLWYDGATLADLRSLQVDHQGTVVSVANAAGTAIAVYNYDEYGIPGNTNYASRFQYTGQAWIPELGMYHYKARIYSPTLGRFLQTDPIGYDDQVNLYAYVANDPVNGRDPTGMCGDNGRLIAGCTVFKDDPGKIPSDMTEVSPSSVSGVNGHAIFGDGSPRAVDFTKVDLSDLGSSVQTLATQDGQLKDAIGSALSSGEPQSVHLTGVRAGGGFEGNTSLGQKAGIGRFSVQIDGTVRPNGNGQWYLDGRVRGEVDRQDYPSDSRRTGIGPAGNALGDRL